MCQGDYNCSYCNYYNYNPYVPGRYAIPCFPYFNPATAPKGLVWLPNGTLVPAPVTPSYNPGCSCTVPCYCNRY